MNVHRNRLVNFQAAKEKWLHGLKGVYPFHKVMACSFSTTFGGLRGSASPLCNKPLLYEKAIPRRLGKKFRSFYPHKQRHFCPWVVTGNAAQPPLRRVESATTTWDKPQRLTQCRYNACGLDIKLLL